MSRKLDLVSRWDGRAAAILEKDAPFGRTDRQLLDYRGVPIVSLERLQRQHFSHADFSGGNFENIHIEDCHFDDCLFHKSSFIHVRHRGNHFRNCTFDGSDFSLAYLGDPSSRFQACSFTEIKLVKTIFLNPIFEHCTFSFRNAKSVDFGCSGFWNCSMMGTLNDIAFRGQYLYPSQRQSHPVPMMTGLHNVDFRHARLKWISPLNGCAVDGIRLPSEDVAFLYRLGDMLKTARKTLENLSGPAHERFLLLCKVISIYVKEQEIGFLCKEDLINKFCDENSAQILFDTLRETYQLGAPYVVA